MLKSLSPKESTKWFNSVGRENYLRRQTLGKKIFSKQVVTGPCAKDEVELMEENPPNKKTETMEVDLSKDETESMELYMPPVKLAPCLVFPP